MLATVDVLPDGRIILLPQEDLLYYITAQGSTEADVYPRDGRTLSDEQRRKIFATLRDIAKWNGDDPEALRGLLTWDFCLLYDCEAFSLSTRRGNAADMTTAREFIAYLLDFCLQNGVPMTERISDRADDLQAAMYLCLKHRTCAVCGRPADLHHIDAIGVGRNRTVVSHIGREAMALCRTHHSEFHTIGRRAFLEKYHVEGVRLDAYLCERLGLRRDGRCADGSSA
jgi:hypothetical protein